MFPAVSSAPNTVPGTQEMAHKYVLSEQAALRLVGWPQRGTWRRAWPLQSERPAANPPLLLTGGTCTRARRLTLGLFSHLKWG